MTSRDFCFWLQGFYEIAEPKEISAKQAEMIKRHLGLVFMHEIDPSYSNDEKIQEMMNDVHNGIKPGIKFEVKPTSEFFDNSGLGYDKELLRC